MQGHYELLSQNIVKKSVKSGFDTFVSEKAFNDLRYYSSCMLLAMSDFCRYYGLSTVAGKRLIEVFELMELEPSIKKSKFRAYLGLTSSVDNIGRQFAHFFSFEDSNGFSLSAEGSEAFERWNATLRRVLQNFDEYYRLKYKRILPSEKAKARANQAFWKLVESDQIAVLRDYYALPFRNEAEKLERKKKRLEIFYKYGLKNKDLLNAVEKYADQVKSVRMQPHLVGIFPVWSGRKRGKPKRQAPPDPEIPIA